MKVYFLSGLGADATAFQALNLPGVEPVHLDWMNPVSGETIQSYAARMAQRITTPNPMIVGLSFGGMLAVEITKIIPVKQLILVSSAKSFHELPPWFRVCRYLPFHKVLPLRYISTHPRIMFHIFGSRNKAQEQQLASIIQNSLQGFNQWAIDKVVNWRNESTPAQVIHIHGKEDNLLPFRYVSADYTIEKGGHFMIVNNAAEISAIIMHTLVKQS